MCENDFEFYRKFFLIYMVTPFAAARTFSYLLLFVFLLCLESQHSPTTCGLKKYNNPYKNFDKTYLGKLLNEFK